MNGIYYAIAYDRAADVFEVTPHQGKTWEPWEPRDPWYKPDPDTDPVAGDGYQFHAGNAQHAARLLRIRKRGARALFRHCNPRSGQVLWLSV